MRGRRWVRGTLSILAGAILLLATVPIAPAVAAEPELRAWPQQVFGDPGAEDDEFGCSTAVHGDTAIIGARGDSAGRGAAYVFVRSGKVWSLQQKIFAKYGVAGDGFGVSVALSGDTALVGAWNEDGYRGAAYIFTRSGTTWTQRARLAAGDGAADDLFGQSVALSGGTALVGAWGENGTRGAAYVFTADGVTWTERAKLTANDGATADFFGESVALSGGTALIGAWGDDGMRGSAYVFTGSESSWAQRAKLVAADGAAQDSFGLSVALSGSTALIGAYGDDNAAGPSAGAAYIFTGSGSAWAQQQKLMAGDGATSDWFGGSVALSGGTAVVGAYGDNGGQGSAYVFTGTSGSWSHRAKIAATFGAADDWFGAAVAVSAGNVLAGALWDDTPVGGPNAGSAWFFRFTNILLPKVTRIAGANRYLTAVAASQRCAPAGAHTVVIATGANWPDALGGSALAGAARGPLLLTKKDALPAEVTAEIARLGAIKAYVLGSTASVSAAVENALVSMLGRANVVRLGGANRYETARKVADETIRLQGAAYTGYVFVATGTRFPDATAASPLAAWLGAPILLANPATGAFYLPAGAKKAMVLGSTSAVPAKVETALRASLGEGKVTRMGGANRYATAAMVAQSGLGVGLQWNGVGLATGENFPDALSAGPMLAAQGSVLLLTRPTALSSEARDRLAVNAASIDSMFISGDTNAVSAAVAAAAAAAAGVP